MRDLYKITDMVKDILTVDENARNSDDYLYHKVCSKLCPEVLSDRFGDVVLTFNDYNLPCYESVSRARRKVQAQFPDLRATEKVERFRYENTIAYEQYARSEVR